MHSHNEPKTDAAGRLLTAGRMLMVGAMAGAMYLAWSGWTQTGPVGCGASSGCHTVLTSRWARWFGLPVGLLALPVYGLALASTSGRWRRAGMVSGWLIWLAAIWFIALQAVVLKSFCWICLATHLCASAGGFLIWRGRDTPPAEGHPSGWGKRPWAVALCLLILLVAGQTIQPHRTNYVSLMGGEGMVRSGGDRQIEIHGKRFALRDLPLWGPPQAAQVMACLFDYTCPHCRVTHGRLAEVRLAFSNELAVVCLPVPLDHQCNRIIEKTTPMHKDACELARLGMAVWKCDAGKFERFNVWMFQPDIPPSLDEARKFARELVGPAALDAVLATDWPSLQVNRGLEIFTANYQAMKQDDLPQLIIGTAISFGEINEAATLFQLLEKQLGLVRKP